MTTLPEALRLADALEDACLPTFIAEEAAAELRRLYQLAMDQQGEIYALKMARSMEQKTAALKRDALRQIVDEQAEDEGLWFRAETAAEAYLQQELRRLHAAVEEGK